jgi:DNA invertase Pin-like site-specific DNA recombinase
VRKFPHVPQFLNDRKRFPGDGLDISEIRLVQIDCQARPAGQNVNFISNLMESTVEFTAVDFPTANRLTVHILAAVAEHEAQAISTRTKEALRSARARGVKLGTPKPQHDRSLRQEGHQRQRYSTRLDSTQSCR